MTGASNAAAEGAYEHLTKAARVFPLSYQFRKGPSDMMILLGPAVDPRVSLPTLDRTLEGDPHAADVLLTSGSIRLLNNDLSGFAYMRRAIKAAPASRRLQRLQGELLAP